MGLMKKPAERREVSSESRRPAGSTETRGTHRTGMQGQEADR